MEFGHLLLGKTSRCRSAYLKWVSSNKVLSYRSVRCLSSAPSSQPSQEWLDRPKTRRAEAKADRDFFLSLLSASTTKRDAKSFLTRFRRDKVTADENAESHLTLIRIRGVESIDDSVFNGLATTFSQLARLGIACIVILDCSTWASNDQLTTIDDTNIHHQQCERVLQIFRREQLVDPIIIDNLLCVSNFSKNTAATNIPFRGEVQVQYPDSFRKWLAAGKTMIIPSTGFLTSTQKRVGIDADQVVLALTRELAGWAGQWSDGQVTWSSLSSKHKLVLDKLVLLDPIGGLPLKRGSRRSHAFVNLDQEYSSIVADLLGTDGSKTGSAEKARLDFAMTEESKGPIRSLLSPQPQNARSLGEESDYALSASRPAHESLQNRFLQHKSNLDLLQQSLSILPPTASGLITTPQDVATLPASQRLDIDDLGVQTRRPKNSLIFNLLTDKPIVSPSLPQERLTDQRGSSTTCDDPPLGPTFLKKGMPLTIIPDPWGKAWAPPAPGESGLTLHDPRIDLPRLLDLIEDSFGRPLNVSHYLSRIHQRLAGLIIAGEYEGGAILTWEEASDSASQETAPRRARLVPYLDKFAVLRKSQGSGGVADIVFNAMVRDCFPQGVCWRSRKDNPVNKWYFERSLGTWQLPKSNWTMFWTTPGVEINSPTWNDYVTVCKSVEPSWDTDKEHAD